LKNFLKFLIKFIILFFNMLMTHLKNILNIKSF
jgi:hypothetical protein